MAARVTERPVLSIKPNKTVILQKISLIKGIFFISKDMGDKVPCRKIILTLRGLIPSESRLLPCFRALVPGKNGALQLRRKKLVYVQK